MNALTVLGILFAFSFIVTSSCAAFGKSRSSLLPVFFAIIDGAIFLGLICLRVGLKENPFGTASVDWFANTQLALSERAWLFLFLLQFLKFVSSLIQSREEKTFSLGFVLGRELTYLSGCILILSGNELAYFTGMFLNAVGFYTCLSFGSPNDNHASASIWASRGFVQLICAETILFVGYLLLVQNSHQSAAMLIIAIGFFARSGLLLFPHLPEVFPLFQREALPQYFIVLVLPAFLSGIFALHHGFFLDPSLMEINPIYGALLLILFCFVLPGLWGSFRSKNSDEFIINIGCVVLGQVFLALMLGQPFAAAQVFVGFVFFILAHVLKGNYVYTGVRAFLLSIQYFFMMGLPFGIFGAGLTNLFAEVAMRANEGHTWMWAVLAGVGLLHMGASAAALRALLIFIFAKPQNQVEEKTPWLSTGLLFLLALGATSFYAGGRFFPWDALPFIDWSASLFSEFETWRGVLPRAENVFESAAADAVFLGLGLASATFLLSLVFLLIWKLSNPDRRNRMRGNLDTKLEKLSSRFFPSQYLSSISWELPAKVFFAGPVRGLKIFETRGIEALLIALSSLLIRLPREIVRFFEGRFNDSRVLRIMSGMGEKLSVLFSASDEISRGGQFVLFLSVLALGLMFLGRG